ncbi:hypothetical protein GCM10009846_08760 [Agrococcus versicolor]|uniref:HTH tetR-type domain-containing protein n=1 Tax=Agrococcus versicolor TaxID=501482 RepID=A0ABP5MG27_9MICO
MASVSSAPGRRERGKQEKLRRIVEAASELLADRGIDDVTTQEIAERADIGAGTLFLYARTKGELLLLVQNSAYELALERGIAAAADVDDALGAILAIVRPIVACNRTQVDNGRTYLREIVFGDPTEPHHRAALGHTAATEAAIAAVLERHGHAAVRAAALAHIVSAIMLVTLASTANAGASNEALVRDVAGQVEVLLA